MLKSKYSQRGASTILWVLSMIPLLGLAALALDGNNLFVVSAELQNAADAGALAGAKHLYNDDGTAIQRTDVVTNVNNAAQANKAQKSTVEVASVEIGHWQFDANGGGEFYPTDSDTPMDLSGKVFYDPDDSSRCDVLNNCNCENAPTCNTCCEINAVRVIAARQNTPVTAFFARILGFNDFSVTAEAVAYIGYAGSLDSGEIDQPIALCQEKIINSDGSYSCSVGRFIDNNQTGRYTDFDQENACNGSSDNALTQKYICTKSGNPEPIVFGDYVSVTNGQVQGDVFTSLYACWKHPNHCENLSPPANNNWPKYCDLYQNDGNALAATSPTQSWHVVLPVLQCLGGSNSCKKIVGAVAVHILWVTNSNSAQDTDVPYEMTMSGPDYTITFDSNDYPQNATAAQRWTAFVNEFNLKNADGSPATWQQKTIYYAPDCNPQTPKGLTMGRNYGIRAEAPVLVN